MTLPNFLGIGAMRAGTSWLYQQLQGHKDVYMSEQKELNFFNHFYDYGLVWYSKHFPSAQQAVRYKAIGEITPTYMANPDVPSRIHVHIPDARFIVMLRNPVDRANSEFNKWLRDFNCGGTFEEFSGVSDSVFRRGFYKEQLERYFQYFPRNQFLILIFEKAVSEPRTTMRRLATFLDIDPHGFDFNRMKRKVNSSYLPRMPRLYSTAIKARNFLVKRDMGWVLVAADKIGLVQVGRHVFRFRGPRAPLPKMDERTRKRLKDLYKQEIYALEELVGIDLSIWRN